ncbi:MAG: EamA family transporter [Acidimicrobiales bacterium]
MGSDSLGSRGAGLGAVPAAGLVVGGVFALEGAAALATSLIPLAGTPGTVALRLGFGAIGLAVIARPDFRRLSSGRAVLLAVVVGAVLAVHHLCFYAAIHRLPLGVAVTLEFLGPLAVALAGSRRLADLGWASLAGLGVAATAGLTLGGRINLAGVLLALAAGASWATYILVFPRLSATLGRAEGLAVASLAGAVIAVPFGVAVDGPRLADLHVLLLGVAVALLADIIAYSLQAEALTKISGRLFSILASTEPAAGALLGLVFLDQRITAWQWAGIAAVTAAAVGAASGHGKAAPPQS